VLSRLPHITNIGARELTPVKWLAAGSRNPGVLKVKADGLFRPVGFRTLNYNNPLSLKIFITQPCLSRNSMRPTVNITSFVTLALGWLFDHTALATGLRGAERRISRTGDNAGGGKATWFPSLLILTPLIFLCGG